MIPASIPCISCVSRLIAGGASCYCCMMNRFCCPCRAGRHGSIVILLLHCSIANISGIFTGANYSNTHIHQYPVHILTFPQYRQDHTSQEVIRDFHRYGTSYLLTTATTLDGDRAEPISPTLLLAVPYLLLGQGALLHHVSI